jgi:hypothetical protein
MPGARAAEYSNLTYPVTPLPVLLGSIKTKRFGDTISAFQAGGPQVQAGIYVAYDLVNVDDALP